VVLNESTRLTTPFFCLADAPASNVNHVAVVERNHVYVDRVEWGATRAIVARIRERCILLSASVCSRGVVWIHPEFTGRRSVQRANAAPATRPGVALRASYLSAPLNGAPRLVRPLPAEHAGEPDHEEERKQRSGADDVRVTRNAGHVATSLDRHICSELRENRAPYGNNFCLLSAVSSIVRP
jgi:hypothetical protein